MTRLYVLTEEDKRKLDKIVERVAGSSGIRNRPDGLGGFSGERFNPLAPDLPELAYNAVFRAKVTSSSGGSEDHTIEEIDCNDEVIEDGRQPTDAKAMNGRKGVPVDTIVLAIQLPPISYGGDPVYRFTPWDGLKDSPADLVPVTDDVDTTDWDVEDQGSDEGFTANTARIFLEADTFSVFGRDITYDASGMAVLADTETRGGLIGDSGLVSLDGHITLRPYAGGPDDKLKVALNEPQDDFRTLVFIPGSGIELNGGTANIEVEFDDSGRALIANAGEDQEITIAATGGGGGADGQGFESVTDGTTTLAKTDGGIISFADTSNSGTTLGVDFAVADNDPTATVTATVDASGLTANDVGAANVVDRLIAIEETAATGDYTIDSTNFSGRSGHAVVVISTQSSKANWDDWSQGGSSSFGVGAFKVGASETSDVNIQSGSGVQVFIDPNDGYKMRLNLSSAPSAGNVIYVQVFAVYGERKTTVDQTIN